MSSIQPDLPTAVITVIIASFAMAYGWLSLLKVRRSPSPPNIEEARLKAEEKVTSLKKEIDALRNSLELTIRDRVADAERIRTLENTVLTQNTKLQAANERIVVLETRIAELERGDAPLVKEPVGKERTLIAVIGSHKGLKQDLAALRAVENACDISVTRCLPASFERFEMTVNRHRAGGNPIIYGHFSVHGSAGQSGAMKQTAAILFEDGAVGWERLSSVLKNFEVVFFAACNSDVLATLLSAVPTVISFKEEVTHDYATLATEIFWLQIGYNKSPKEAFRITKDRLPSEAAEYIEIYQRASK